MCVKDYIYPWTSVRIYVRFTACDVISFNGHQQDRHSTCAGGRDLSNLNEMNTIQSYRSEKNADKYMTLNQKFQWKHGEGGEERKQ